MYSYLVHERKKIQIINNKMYTFQLLHHHGKRNNKLCDQKGQDSERGQADKETHQMK